MFAIPLFWLLPAYLTITVISPCLLSHQSTYGHRPNWLTPKVRYFSIAIPALVTLGLAVYTSQPEYTLMSASEEQSYDTSIYMQPYYIKRQYCLQWYPQPYLALASSFLVLIETYITYRLDIQLPPHRPDIQLPLHQEQQESVPDTCGKSFCFHECVSSIIHKNLSPQSPLLASTYCSTVRLLRNIRIVVSVVGTLLVGFIIALLYGTSEYALRNMLSSYNLWVISAHIIALFLWLHAIISLVRPTVTRPALDLHPVLRFVFTLFPGLALLTYSVFSASGFIMGFYCDDGWCRVGMGYSLVGILFSSLMALEAILTFKFDRRRYNTARKVQLHKHQSHDGDVVLVDNIDDGEFQEPESYDDKVQASV